MSDDSRLQLLYEVALMHYEQRLTNTQIANRIQKSSTHVVRLLQEAQDRHIVRVEVVPPPLFDLSDRLQRRFDCLKEAIVVQSTGDFGENQRVLGKAAAAYFDEKVPEGSKVGVSGGNTVDLMIKDLRERERNIEIYPTQLIGQGPHIPQHKDVFVAISELWDKCKRQGSAYYTTVPPFERPDGAKRKSKPEDIGKALRAEHERWRKRETIQTVWQRMQEITIVFASVGQFGPDPGGQLISRTLLTLLHGLGISEQWLTKERVVGDLSFSLFDAEGTTRTPRWDFFLTLGVDHFRKMAADYPRRRVVLVVGERKSIALAAALRGRLANVLITVDTVAEELLRR